MAEKVFVRNFQKLSPYQAQLNSVSSSMDILLVKAETISKAVCSSLITNSKQRGFLCFFCYIFENFSVTGVRRCEKNNPVNTKVMKKKGRRLQSPFPIHHLMEGSRRDGNEDELRKKGRVGEKIWGLGGLLFLIILLCLFGNKLH